jgi:hypothetical protein
VCFSTRHSGPRRRTPNLRTSARWAPSASDPNDLRNHGAGLADGLVIHLKLDLETRAALSCGAAPLVPKGARRAEACGTEDAAKYPNSSEARTALSCGASLA